MIAMFSNATALETGCPPKVEPCMNMGALPLSAEARLSVYLVVLPGELDDGLHRLGTRRHEEGRVQVTWRYLRDLVRQLKAPRMLEAPVREEAQLFHLLVGRVRKLRPAVPNLRGEKPRKAVYKGVALGVGNVGAFSGDYDRELGPILRIRREVEHQVLNARERGRISTSPETTPYVHTSDHLTRPGRVETQNDFDARRPITPGQQAGDLTVDRRPP